MGANRVVKSYTFAGGGGTFTAPGGVKRVRVTATQIYEPFFPGTTAAFIDSSNLMYGIGWNDQGQLGDTSQTDRSTPTVVTSLSQFWRSVSNSQSGSTNSNSSYFINTGGVLYSCGANANGQLGNGGVAASSAPTLISSGLGATLTAKKVLAGINASGNSTLILTMNNQVYGLGLNQNGQLGNGDVTPRSSPTLVTGGVSFVDIKSRLVNAWMGITAAGALYGCGLNVNGQLGVGDVTPRSSPVAVLGGLTFSSFEFANYGSGTASAYGLTSAGAAYAWGLNTNGQLGLGDVTPRSSPVAVLGGLTFSQVASNQASTYYLTTAGAAYAVGLNDSGQLGNGDVTPRSSPVAVLGGLTFSQIITPTGGTANKFVFLMQSDGTLYAMGLNASGQLGVGDVNPRSSPVAVLGGLKFAAVYVYNTSVWGVTTQGVPYAWGLNSHGELGFGDVTPRSSPVLINSAKRVNTTLPKIVTDIDVVPGTSYTVAFNNYNATFGSIVIGQMISSAEVEYFQ